jgi:hypothetical protein
MVEVKLSALVLARFEEETEHIEEIGAVLGPDRPQGCAADALHAPMSMAPVISSANVARPSCVAVVRGELQCQRGQVRLFAPVQRGERMHEGLVFEQLVAVVLGEAGGGAQADAGGAGGRLRDQVGIDLDPHLVVHEEASICSCNSSCRISAGST